MCVYVGFLCYGIHIDVRGQLEAGFLILPCDPGDHTQVIHCGCEHL